MNSSGDQEVYEKVEKALESIRPFLQKDGGDVEFLDLTTEYEVQIKLVGSCANCLMSNMTLKNGIEESVKRFAPEVKGIVEIRDEG